MTGYGHTIDNRDFDALERLFATDAKASYAGRPCVEGAGAIAAWVKATTTTVTFSQHLLQIMDMTIDGDAAGATVNLQALQVFSEQPTTAQLLAGRYTMALERGDNGNAWLITELTLTVGWRGTAIT